MGDIKLTDAAREAVEKWDAWLYSGATLPPGYGEVEVAMIKLRQAVFASLLRDAPKRIGDIPAWITTLPEQYYEYMSCEMPGGGVAVSDSHGILVVDAGHEPTPIPPNADAPPLTPGMVKGIFAGPVAPTVDIDSSGAEIRKLLLRAVKVGGFECVRVGDSALNVDKLRLWLLPVLDVYGDCRVMSGSSMDAVVFRGKGWRAAVMPLRFDAKVRIPSLTQQGVG